MEVIPVLLPTAPGAKPTLLPITHEVGATHPIPYTYLLLSPPLGSLPSSGLTLCLHHIKLIPAPGPLHSPGLSRSTPALNIHEASPAFHSQPNSHITSSKRPFLTTQSVSPHPIPSYISFIT